MRCKYCKKEIKQGEKFRSEDVDLQYKIVWHEECPNE